MIDKEEEARQSVCVGGRSCGRTARLMRSANSKQRLEMERIRSSAAAPQRPLGGEPIKMKPDPNDAMPYKPMGVRLPRWTSKIMAIFVGPKGGE